MSQLQQCRHCAGLLRWGYSTTEGFSVYIGPTGSTACPSRTSRTGPLLHEPKILGVSPEPVEHRQTIAYDEKGNILDESIKPGTDAQHPEIIPVGQPTNEYKVKEAYQDIWAVQFVRQMPARTTKYVAVFYGDISKERATEYADWKNRT